MNRPTDPRITAPEVIGNLESVQEDVEIVLKRARELFAEFCPEGD